MCEGKVPYPSAKSAKRAARWQRRQGIGPRWVHATLRAYACRYCPSWHIGHDKFGV